MKPGPHAKGMRKPTIFGKHRKWLKEKAEEQRRAKEEADAAKAATEEKHHALAKKSQQRRGAILFNNGGDVTLEDVDADAEFGSFDSTAANPRRPEPRESQPRQSGQQRPPLHELARPPRVEAAGPLAFEAFAEEATAPVISPAEEAAEAARAAEEAAEAARAARLRAEDAARKAASAARAARHPEMISVDPPTGGPGVGSEEVADEFDSLIDDAIGIAKARNKPTRAPPPVAGPAKGNGAVEFIKLPPPARVPPNMPMPPMPPATPDRADAEESWFVGTATSPKQPPKSPGVKSQQQRAAQMPAWALPPEQARARQEEEEEDLLSFADGLDFDKFEADMVGPTHRSTRARHDLKARAPDVSIDEGVSRDPSESGSDAGTVRARVGRTRRRRKIGARRLSACRWWRKRCRGHAPLSNTSWRWSQKSPSRKLPGLSAAAAIGR